MDSDGIACEVRPAPRPHPITQCMCTCPRNGPSCAFVASDIRAPCRAMQVGGHLDGSGYYYTASHMFEVRLNCPVSCSWGCE